MAPLTGYKSQRTQAKKAIFKLKDDINGMLKHFNKIQTVPLEDLMSLENLVEALVVKLEAKLEKFDRQTDKMEQFCVEDNDENALNDLNKEKEQEYEEIEGYKDQLIHLKQHLKDIQKRIIHLKPKEEPVQLATPATPAMSQEQMIQLMTTGITGLFREHRAEDAAAAAANPQQVRAKLPKFEIPKFTGDVLQWTGFWSQFSSAIHTNRSLPDIEKFQYLRSYLTGEPFTAVDAYAFTPANYPIVVAYLKERYGKTDKITESHFLALQNLPISSTDSTKLRNFYDTLERHLRVLESLGEGIENLSYVSIIKQKISEEILKDMEISKPHANKWTVALLRQHLKEIVEMREELHNSKSATLSSNVSRETSSFEGTGAKPRMKPPRSAGHSLVAFEKPQRQENQRFSSKRPCIYCGKPHWSDECPSISTAELRRKKLNENKRCLKCISEKHTTKDCRCTKPCVHCGQSGHHRSICETKFKGSTEDHKKLKDPKKKGPKSGFLAQADNSDTEDEDDSTSIPKTKEQFLNYPTNQSSLLAKDASTIMRTALAKVLHPDNPKGQHSIVNVIFDTGSSNSHLILDVAKELHLDKGAIEEVPTATFGTDKVHKNSICHTEILVELKDGSHLKMNVRVIPLVSARTHQVPYGKLLPPEVLKVFKDLPRADRIPYKPKLRSYQLLIGNDYYESFMSIGKMEPQPGLTFQNTKFGWIITGRIEDHGPKLPTPNLFVHSYLSGTQPDATFLVVQDSAIPTSPDMKMFWNIETIGIEPPSDKTDEEEAVKQFNDTVKKVNGRYEVSWPKKISNPDLPDNYSLAYHRLKSQCKKFKERPELFKKCNEIIQDQIKKGIIEPVTEETEEGPLKHYIPHHVVETPDKLTTRARMVFDASARKNKHSLCLNDTLYAGPSLIHPLIGLILRFRLSSIAIIADIEKAFLNIGLQIPDRDVTRFFWFKDPIKPSLNGNTQIYRFCRIPFGVNSSPFLLASTVNHLLEEYGTSVALRIREDIYVDNVITGAPDVDAGFQLYKESQEIFKTVSLNLREWSSNSQEFLAKIPPIHRAQGKMVKVLGIQWNTEEDTLTIVGFDKKKFLYLSTKREVLQALASVYDPMGYFSPVTLVPKLFLCKLWIEKFDWDHKLPPDKLDQWKEIYDQLKDISSYSIPRFIGHDPTSGATFQLICFCDASATSYATAVYLRSSLNDTCLVNLQFSKTRLASPKKKWSIPRLELLAAVVGVRSMDSVAEWLHLPITSKTLFSDSKCVLYWIKSPKKLSVFVENRVKEIRKSEDITYRYVQTTSNPADYATRGRTVEELSESNWWHGPQWLKEPEETWPTGDMEPFDQTTMDAIESETRKNAQFLYEVTLLVQEGPLGKEMATPYGIKSQDSSSLRKLFRVTTYCTRFISNCSSRLKWRNKLHKRFQTEVKLPYLSTKEIFDAHLWWNLTVQQHWYADVIVSMQQGKKPKLCLELGLRIDEKGLLRCYGRYENAIQTEAAKQPILLPTKDYFTKLVIEEYHKSALHAGVSQTLAMIRQRYWIPQGRSRVRLVLSDCRICKRIMGGPYKLPVMAPWPKEKMIQSPPFTFTGLDYFGPLYIDEQGLEKKVWICLFTCVATRAIHLELINDMSTEEFIQCFRRFISIRGKPEQLISDNATQFKLAKTTLDKAWNSVINDPDTLSYIASKGITWKFIIQFAPWTGGFYERMVGIVKSSLKKSVGILRLKASQLATMLTEVQAVVNSRPLVYVHEDVNSEIALSPGHFLGLNPQVGVPILSKEVDDVDPDYNYLPESSAESLIRTWKTGQKHLDQFWKIWKNSYLLSLRERYQHRVSQGRIQSPKSVAVGDVVLIKDNLPRGSWKLGKIKTLITSSDGAIRAANVILPSKRTLNRPINLLFPIECPSILSVLDKSSIPDMTDTSGTQQTDPNLQGSIPIARPRRTAAVRGRETVQTWIRDMVGLALTDKCTTPWSAAE